MRSGGTPDFDASPERLTSTSAGTVEAARGRLRAERVDELADPVDDLRLVRLEVADEVPAERVAVDRVLALEVLGAVLADHLDPGFDEHGHVLERTRTSSPRRPSRRCRPRRGCARTRRGRPQATRAITPWTPRGFPVRRCEKNSSGLHDVQRSTRSTSSTPAARSARSADGPEVEVSAVQHVVPERGGERLGHLRPDLVAARPDRGADRRVQPPAERAHAAPRRCRPGGRASRRAGRRRRAAVADARQRDRQAVRAHREHRQVRLLRPEPVARLASRAGLGSMDKGGVDLPVERKPVGRRADLRAEAPPVLVDPLDVVAGHPPQVQRVVRDPR